MHLCELGYSKDFPCSIAMHLQTLIMSFGNSRCDLWFYKEIHIFEEKKQTKATCNITYEVSSVTCFSTVLYSSGFEQEIKHLRCEDLKCIIVVFHRNLKNSESL